MVGPVFNLRHRVRVSLSPSPPFIWWDSLPVGCELVPYGCFNFYLIVIKLVTFLYVYVLFGLLGKAALIMVFVLGVSIRVRCPSHVLVMG